jgi:hypothetical protein
MQRQRFSRSTSGHGVHDGAPGAARQADPLQVAGDAVAVAGDAEGVTGDETAKISAR